MNLSTTRSSKRAVEIGVRKVLGAEKNSLIRQFLWEAILLALISFIISIGLTLLPMPLFEQVSGKEYSFSNNQYAWLIAVFLLVTLIAGLVAGVYPAFYLSAFKPVKVLKGRFANSLAAISFRKVLVVFQFVISVALIVASTTISNQMNYLRNKDLGFEKDQQLIIPLRSSTARGMYYTFRNELLSNPSVANAGASIYYPGIPNVTDWLLYKQGTPSDQTKTVYMNRIDESYLQTLGIKPIPFEYSFLDDDFQKTYQAEEGLAAIIRYFTIVAIFISCLGLFGLTTFSVEQRTKEIGIRKVLGASTAGIVSLLSKDFLKLVLISFLVASPLAWYFINQWLQSFAYRAPFTIWLLLGASAIALLIAFLTISIQAMKVAFSNPVKSLRIE